MLTTLLLSAALQAAAPAPPVAPTPPAPSIAEPGTKVVREIIIVGGKDPKDATVPEGMKKHREIMIVDQQGDTRAADRERIRMYRHGPGEGRIAMLRNCEGAQQFETRADGEKDGKAVKTHVKFCHKGKPDPAAMVEGLERASKRIAENKEMPEEVRSRVLASLQAEIARLKAARP